MEETAKPQYTFHLSLLAPLTLIGYEPDLRCLLTSFIEALRCSRKLLRVSLHDDLDCCASVRGQ
jgi:hypothetical protein